VSCEIAEELPDLGPRIQHFPELGQNSFIALSGPLDEPVQVFDNGRFIANLRELGHGLRPSSCRGYGNSLVP
jgi:hypothetical protein